jgi:hypothetical protein
MMQEIMKVKMSTTITIRKPQSNKTTIKQEENTIKKGINNEQIKTDKETTTENILLQVVEQQQL